jgi:hypothetical protein
LPSENLTETCSNSGLAPNWIVRLTVESMGGPAAGRRSLPVLDYSRRTC